MILMRCIHCFSKIVPLVSLQKSDAITIAGNFPSMVASQYRFPEHIMSNCDPHFCGHFWDE